MTGEGAVKLLKRAVLGLAITLLALGSQVQSASASVSWGTLQFACEGVTVQAAPGTLEEYLVTPPAIYITGFEDIHAEPTRAFWGVTGYFPRIGHQFATSSVLITHYSVPSANLEGRSVIVDKPVPVGQEAVTCIARRGPGNTDIIAEVVFLSPVPTAPPSVTYSSRSSLSPFAPPGIYEDQVVRSEQQAHNELSGPQPDGCFDASPVGDPSTLQKFCVDDFSNVPALFQIVDITVSPDLMASLGVEVAPLRTPRAKADCKGGGWRDLVNDEGRTFRNQGRCIAFANHVRR